MGKVLRAFSVKAPFSEVVHFFYRSDVEIEVLRVYDMGIYENTTDETSHNLFILGYSWNIVN